MANVGVLGLPEGIPVFVFNMNWQVCKNIVLTISQCCLQLIGKKQGETGGKSIKKI